MTGLNVLPQIRDQGVGGSNPLSPTNLVSNFQEQQRLKEPTNLVLHQVLWGFRNA